jgi:hypothetical protein
VWQPSPTRRFADTPIRSPPTTRFRCGALHSPKVIRRRARVDSSCLSEAFQRSDPIERRRGFGYRNHSKQMRLSKERQQRDES